MIAGLVITLFFLLVVFMIVHISRNRVVYDDFEDEEIITTHTTTTTTTVVDEPQTVAQPEYTVVGDVKRSKARNGQFYVMDPVDKDKIFVNATDDLYEDGAGKIWNLV
jgi:uncharacterized protein YpmB